MDNDLDISVKTVQIKTVEILSATFSRLLHQPSDVETEVFKSGTSFDVEKRLISLEKNVDFLMKLGIHQDNLLKKAETEILRLKSTSAGSNINEKEQNGNSSANEVYFGNVPPNKTVADLRQYFSKYGKIVDIFILRKHANSQNGLVKFSEKSMAKSAVDDYPHFLNDNNGRHIIVQMAKGRRERHRSFIGKENSPIILKNLKSQKIMSTKARRYSPY